MMENQLEEQVADCVDSFFMSNQSDSMSRGSNRSVHQEESFKSFSDGIICTNTTGVQAVSNLALLTEPFALTLPEIQSTFSFDSATRQPVQTHHSTHVSTEITQASSSYQVDHSQFQHASNMCSVDRHTNQLRQDCNNDKLHEDFPTLSDHGGASDIGFIDSYQWPRTSQLTMNSNNNNVNDNNQLVAPQNASYFVQDEQNGSIMSSHEVVSTVSAPSAGGFMVPLRRRSSINGVGSRPGELNGLKYSPDAKKRGGGKKRKKRGSNEPQKPVSAYALFFRDTQANIKSDNPSATFGEISKVVASMWDGLNEGAKQVYKQKTETAKRDYLKQLAAYRANLVSRGGLDVDNDEANFKRTDPPFHSSFYTTLSQNTLPNISARDLSLLQRPARVYAEPNDVTAQDNSLLRGIPSTYSLVQSSSIPSIVKDSPN